MKVGGVGGVIFPLLLLGLQTCNSWSQQHGCCWLPEQKTPLRDKLHHFCLEQLHPFRDAVTWDTQVLIIWTPASCINTDGRIKTFPELKTASSSHVHWATSSLEVARQNGKTSGLLPPDHSCVYTNVAWKHQKSTGLLGTFWKCWIPRDWEWDQDSCKNTSGRA